MIETEQERQKNKPINFGTEIFSIVYGFHYTHSITYRPPSWHDLNIVEQDVKSRVIHPFIIDGRRKRISHINYLPWKGIR